MLRTLALTLAALASVALINPRPNVGASPCAIWWRVDGWRVCDAMRCAVLCVCGF